MCILLVEDEPVLLIATELYLKEAGYEVLTAQHGQQACSHVDHHPDRFTCLVTDFHLPGKITGAHIVQHMRRAYPLIPMILTSAVSTVTTHGWKEEHGVEFLTKPYDPEDLVTMIASRLPQ